jgi:uncharacterized protein (TIGR02596 family)
MTARNSFSKPAAAFTMIEMIAVVSIVAVLITFSAPYVTGVLNATRLRTAADTVYNRMLEAQSLALLFNTDVELRLYEVPDLIDSTSRPTLRKLRVLTLQPPDVDDEAATASGGVFEPVGAITHLEQGVEINPAPEYSSIIDLGFVDAPEEDAHGRYVAVRFRSDGSASLLPGKPWFLTLHEKDAHLRGTKLRNFVTIQIDPATGRLRSFQP